MTDLGSPDRILNSRASAEDRRVRVLVVDDSQVARRIISRLLQDSGRCEVVGEASDGEEGLHRFHELSPEVVAIDVHMPRVNGLEMVRRLRAVTDVPVVLVTALPPEAGDLSAAARFLKVKRIVTKTFGDAPLDLSEFARELVEAVVGAAREHRSGSGH